MQILKAYFKVAAKLAPSLIMYIVIFVTIGVLISNLSPASSESFSAGRLDVVIYDDDNTPESKAFVNFISEKHEIIECERDIEVLQDKLYYGVIDYVLVIDKGYSEKIRNGETTDLFSYTVDPKSYNAEYLNMQIRQYISALDMYLKADKDFDTAQEKAIKAVTDETEVITQTKNAEQTAPKFVVFERYLAYVYPAMMITVLARIIIELKRKELRDRTFCSPISSLSFNMQIFAGSVIFCIIIWIFMQILTFILLGKVEFSETSALFIFNNFIFLMVSAGIAILISMCLSGNSFIIDMLANIICLGMAFLCGVFVDQTLLGEGVLTIGRFLPAYWYVCAVDSIGQASGKIFDINYIWQCMGVEALYAVALFTASMAVAKFKKTA